MSHLFKLFKIQSLTLALTLLTLANLKAQPLKFPQDPAFSPEYQVSLIASPDLVTPQNLILTQKAIRVLPSYINEVAHAEASDVVIPTLEARILLTLTNGADQAPCNASQLCWPKKIEVSKDFIIIHTLQGQTQHLKDVFGLYEFIWEATLEPLKETQTQK